MKRIVFAFILLMILAACGGSEDEPTSTPDPTPSPTFPVLPPIERSEIEESYEVLRQLHVELSNIWESLSRGETAQCGTGINVPDPASLSEPHETFDQLRLAASELRAAANRWEAECANPRENVPQEVIEGGLLEVRAAGDALREVEAFLSEN